MQAYALVETRLHAVLNKPTAQTIAHIGQPLSIEAELYNDSTPVVPQPNEATVNAHVTVLVNGQPASVQDVELVQESGSPLFTRQITLSGPVGQVKIEIRAVYRQIPVEASGAQVTIPLQARIIPPRPVVKVQPCGTNLACYWQRYPVQTATIPLLVLLLLLLSLWFLQKGPYGSLQQGRLKEPLGSMSRSFLRRLLHKSVLSAQELAGYGFNFGEAKFDLLFRGGGRVLLKAKSETPDIKVKKGNLFTTAKPGEDVDLSDRDEIHVAGCTPATYLELDDDTTRER